MFMPSLQARAYREKHCDWNGDLLDSESYWYWYIC